MNTKKLNYQVVEDNGGGLHLVVLSKRGRAIYVHSGYEYCHGQLQNDLNALDNGGDPVADGWDGCEDNPRSLWQDMLDNINSGGHGYQIVADNDTGTYTPHTDRMGTAAEAELTANQIANK